MRKWSIGAVVAVVIGGLAVIDGQSIVTSFDKLRATSTAADALVVSGGGQFSGLLQSAGAVPQLRLNETDESAGGRLWITMSNTGAYQVRAYDDAGADSNVALSITRSGHAIGQATWGATQHLSANGEAGAPVYSFSSDPDTGIYRPSSDQVGISTGGAPRATWSNTAQTSEVPILGPGGSAGAPTYSFSGAPTAGMYYSSGGVQIAVAGTASMYWGPRIINMTAQGAGIGVSGRLLTIGRNSTGDGAPGMLLMEDRAANNRYLFFDTSGRLRTGAVPNESTLDTLGTVVGDQTSSLDAKWLRGQPKDRDLLSAVLRTKVHRFTYKDGRYNGEMFTGIVTDESPWFAKDQGKALNEINGIGYLVGAVRELERRLAASEARVRALEARTVVGQ
jgi:hypothetical protein